MSPRATTAADDLHERIEQLAEINSGREGGGITREVYTSDYERASEYVAELMRDAELEVRLDSAGNLFGRWAGTAPDLPRVLTGSHFDTTLNAGRFDGVVGVLGAIEAVRELRRAGIEPRRTIEVVGFAGEEPRFGAGCIGSRAMVGAITREQLDQMRDRDGVSVAEAMRGCGLDPDRIGEALLDGETVHALVELHIEQGVVLESTGAQIGVVERIAAPHDLRVTLRGSAMHAGATPMRLRRDALAGAGEVVLELERLALASRSGSTVGTVGVLRVSPCAVNVIPGLVEMDVDIRDSDLAARDAVVDALLAKLEETASRRGLALTISTLTRDDPAACSPIVIDAVRSTCEELAVRYLEMTSGAYHDAMVLSAKVPIGMIFVPSVDGLSHHPDEYTHRQDIDRGVKVLAGALARLAN
jgi:hydantoinase/carbamoylase family amidase